LVVLALDIAVIQFAALGSPLPEHSLQMGVGGEDIKGPGVQILLNLRELPIELADLVILA
jgi:hypothetical protein